jgi:hypothetical protein
MVTYTFATVTEVVGDNVRFSVTRTRRDGAEAEGDHVSHRDRHQVEQADKP